jgi:hypothetical protein
LIAGFLSITGIFSAAEIFLAINVVGVAAVVFAHQLSTPPPPRFPSGTTTFLPWPSLGTARACPNAKCTWKHYYRPHALSSPVIVLPICQHRFADHACSNCWKYNRWALLSHMYNNKKSKNRYWV